MYFLKQTAIPKFLSAVLPAIFISSLAWAEGIIIDHTAVNQFDRIPREWLETAKRLRMVYASQSHGLQIVSGLQNLMDYSDPVKYQVNYTLFYTAKPAPTNTLLQDLGGHRICHLGRTSDGYWHTPEGRAETRSFAASGLYDLSMFGGCGDFSSGEYLTNFVNEYLHTLDAWEKEFPSMRFIYQTGFSDGNPSWSKLKFHNDMIREYCRTNNKVLFDFADIESWDPDGNYYPNNDEGCSWATNWCAIHPQDCTNLLQRCESGLPSCCPHTHGLNCKLKAKAYWVMLARLVGWDPSFSSPPLFLKLKRENSGIIQIEFPAASNTVYVLQFKANSLLTPWQNLTTIYSQPYERNIFLIDSTTGNSSNRFYRVSAQPAP